MSMEQASQIRSYRKATLKDLDPLLQLGLDAYEVYKDTLSATGWREMRYKLEDIAALEKLVQIATVFVCEADGRMGYRRNSGYAIFCMRCPLC